MRRGNDAPARTRFRRTAAGAAVGTTLAVSAVGPTDGDIQVSNLAVARPPSDGPFPGDGEYLLPLEPGLKPGEYNVAGWPRSPGVREFHPGEELKYTEEETGPDGKPRTVFKSYTPPQHIRPPLVYPWNDAVQAQLRKLGYSW